MQIKTYFFILGALWTIGVAQADPIQDFAAAEEKVRQAGQGSPENQAKRMAEQEIERLIGADHLKGMEFKLHQNRAFGGSYEVYGSNKFKACRVHVQINIINDSYVRKLVDSKCLDK